MTLVALQDEIVACARCPRLVEWREKIASEKVRRFAADEYWGKPVPSFGDPAARLLVVGLAPAAHGGNRTGRIFTGDRSGDWLYRALYRAGFANQSESVNRNDGLVLRDCYVTAAAHCAPPANKLLPEELSNCRPFLLDEIRLLANVCVVVALGRVAFDAAYSSLTNGNEAERSPRRIARPRFAHGAMSRLDDKRVLLASFHPSQQNTFTGRLTEEMLDAVFQKARQTLEAGSRV